MRSNELAALNFTYPLTLPPHPGPLPRGGEGEKKVGERQEKNIEAL